MGSTRIGPWIREPLRGGGSLLVGAALLGLIVGSQEPPPEPPPSADPGDSETVAGYRETAEDKDRPIDHYNLGTALLLDDRWLESRAPLQGAAASERTEVREYGLYNYGVASALAGHEGEEQAEARRQELLAARGAFRELLREDPADEDTRWNLELVEAWLEQDEQQSGGQGSAGGASQQNQGGGAQGASQAGGQGQDRRPLTPEEAAALLDSAGQAEADIRERMLGRTRYRDPVVEKNW